MIEQIFSRILKRRHFWRYASFGEVSQLYMSRFLRQVARFMINMFIAIYMYELGYKLYEIALFYICYFAAKIVMTYPSAVYISKFGPKHGILIGNILSIPALLSFSLLEVYGAMMLVVFIIFQSFSVTVYTMSHNINFSRVKNAPNAGKEIGYMYIIDKLTAGLAPLFGGIVAWQTSPQVTIWIAVVLYCVATVPLLSTGEPIKTKQKLRFSGFPWRLTWRSFVGNFGVGIDTYAATIVWPLFLAVVLFAGSSDSVYAKIGALATITLLVSFVASYVYGRVIDRKQGRQLLKYSVLVDSFTHLVRIFITTPVGAGLVNVISDTTSTGYMMAYTRGQYDLADRSGNRVAYMCVSESMFNVGNLALAGILYLAARIEYGAYESIFAVCFLLASILMLLILGSRFPLYRK